MIGTGTAFADPAAIDDGIAAIATAFEREVDRKLPVPAGEQADYAGALRAELARAGKEALRPEFVLLVDRSPAVQAAFLYWISAEDWRFIGASPVATGLPGAYEHFLTPLGVFEHSVANMDFRAEGTVNEFGVRGYGLKGMRVFDFGWVMGERGWGEGGMSPMRLEMHATDPGLEKLLGTAHSEGCIRIPATLDRFLDHHGILDANYERVVTTLGMRLSILLPDREPTPWAGRTLVIIDSERSRRPAWSPLPGRQAPQSPSSPELDAPRSGGC
ncbi:MAG: L,D-transpeptidase [Burkholderiales bacterium]